MSRSSTTSAAPQTAKSQAAAAAQGQACGTAQGCPPADKVAALAYQKWVKKGCKHGQDKQDWLEAEAELRAQMNGGKK